MTTEIIYYKQQTGKNTRAPLRIIEQQDQDYLHDVFTCYQILSVRDPRPEFREWFTKPNELLPKLLDRGTGYNSPETWSQGICDKLNQAHNRRDLSPVQCAGIEALSQQMSEIYDIPNIEFRDRALAKTPAVNTNFGQLFKKMKP